MFTPYRGSRTISVIVRTAKHTHMPYMWQIRIFSKTDFHYMWQTILNAR